MKYQHTVCLDNIFSFKPATIDLFKYQYDGAEQKYKLKTT